MLTSLKFDFINHWKTKSILIFAFVFAQFLFSCGLVLSNDQRLTGIGDIVMVFYRGDSAFTESRSVFLFIIVVWILMFMVPCILTSYYAYASDQGFGGQLLIRSTSRSRWLKSRIIWIAANTFVIVVLELLVIVLCSALSNQGAPLWGFTDHMFHGYALGNTPREADSLLVIIELFITAYIYLTLVSCLCYLLMNILTLVGGLLTILVYVFITFLTSLPILLCTHIMFVRSAPFEPSGPPLYQGIILGVVALVALFFLTKPLSRFVRF